ncbi:MAG: DUF5989 family protein [Acidobacteriota bacterium]
MSDEREAFERAAEESAPGLVSETAAFLRHNKKWWLTPIVIALFLLGFLIFLGSTGAAPFIYALF